MCVACSVRPGGVWRAASASELEGLAKDLVDVTVATPAEEVQTLRGTRGRVWRTRVPSLGPHPPALSFFLGGSWNHWTWSKALAQCDLVEPCLKGPGQPVVHHGRAPTLELV